MRSVLLEWDLDPAMALVVVAPRRALPRGGPPAGPTHPAPPLAGRPHGVVRAGPARDPGRHAVRPGPLRRGAVLAPHRPAHPPRDGGARAAGAVGSDHPRAAGEPAPHPADPGPVAPPPRRARASPNPVVVWVAVRRDAVRPLLLAPLRAVAAEPLGAPGRPPPLPRRRLPVRVGRGRHRRAAPARSRTRPACCSCCWRSRSTPSSASPCCRPTSTRSAPTSTVRSCATWGSGLAADQRVGAGLLWAVGDLLGLVVGGIVLVQWIAADERRQAREDRLLDANETSRCA